MKKSPIDIANASLKMVPYCVAKNPSEPSLIVSAISYMLLGPISLSKIHPSMFMAIAINMREITNVEKAIKVEGDDDTNIANNRIAMGPVAIMPILITVIESDWKLL